MKLRDYQVPHCERIFAALKSRRFALDASDTGTGKTYVALECCKRLGLVPMVVGPKSASGAWEYAAEDAGTGVEFVGYEKLRGVRKSKTGFRSDAVVNSEWLMEQPWGKGSFLKWKRPPAMVIFDECFPKGTLVRTFKGEIPIERIKCGDMLATPQGYFPVTRTICVKKPRSIFTITHEHGKLICTGNHKIATARGLVCAKDLSPLRDVVYYYNKATDSKILFGGLRKSRPSTAAKRSEADAFDDVKSGFHVATSLYNSYQPESSHSLLIRMEADSFSKCGYYSRFAKSFGANSRVLSVVSAGTCDKTYNLEVKNEHVYYADGLLVSNCHRCAGATSLNSKALIAAKRQAQYVLALSATAADDPRQMKALGYALDLHGLGKRTRALPDYTGWLLRHGCTPGVFGGFDFSRNDNTAERAFQKMHRELFGSGKAARMRKAEIPGFPQTSVNVKMLAPEGDEAGELAARLHEANIKGHEGLEESIRCRQQLEELKAPFLVDLAMDYILTSKVVIFVNFTKTLKKLCDKISIFAKTGLVWGEQSDTERRYILSEFQANCLDVLICNIQAGGEAANMHDPTGQVERTALICPCDSGRRYVQVQGRVNRDGGARSQQYVVFFKNTYEEKVARRMEQKGMNVGLFNDADLLV